VTSALLAACRRVAENQSIPKQDATLKVGSKLLCWSAMEKLHLKLSFPREDPAGVLLEEFYPALLVCMADDLLREGAGESARTSSLRCTRWRRRILRPARLFCSTCTSASAPTLVMQRDFRS